MPKIIELTVELEIRRESGWNLVRLVSCPGVWLCQDGKVTLTVYALGTSYQTCLLPPIFPLMFKDVFYFRKRFQANCALSNICCVLKDEIIYCELLQKLNCCNMSTTIILAQYLGQLNDMLFPPNVCSNDGVDLLMRRTKDFPGILSPKIEVTTKVRIDEVSCSPTVATACYQVRTPSPCGCSYGDSTRQKKVCHTPRFHRTMCRNDKPSYEKRSKSLAVSPKESRSHNPLYHEIDMNPFARPPRISRSPRRVSPSLSRSPSPISPRTRSPSPSNSPGPPIYPHRRRTISPSSFKSRSFEYNVDGDFDYNPTWNRATTVGDIDAGSNDERIKYNEAEDDLAKEETLHRSILESRFVDREQRNHCVNYVDKYTINCRQEPCVCEICKRYHDMFHSDIYET